MLNTFIKGSNMSKREINIRRSCDEINAIADLLIENLSCNYKALGKILKKTSHRIKRTTWRVNTKTQTKVIFKGDKTITTSGCDVTIIPYY